MISKVILGVIMGLLVGSCAKALITAKSNPLLSPTAKNWFSFSVSITPLIVLSWIVYTFIEYPTKFGFYAIGEVILGIVAASFLSHDGRLIITSISVPSAIILWAIL